MGGSPTSATPLSSTEFHASPLTGGWRIARLADADPVEAGLARQRACADALADPSSLPFLMVWRSWRALLVSRSETRLPRFQEVCAQLLTEGWPVLQRQTGGSAIPIGPATVQAATIETAGPAVRMDEKYEALARLIQSVLQTYRITARVELVARAYCPGRYDLAVDSRKIAGMSQHWFRNSRGVHCIITAASINVEESPDTLARIINQFYQGAGSPIRCDATALTNIRQCLRSDNIAANDLPSDLIDQFASQADRLASQAD